MNNSKKRGFSVIEMVAVFAVLLILAALVTASFSSFKKIQTLNASADNIISFLNEARFAAVSSRDFSEHGVHFESAKTVFFKGSVFSSGDPSNKEIVMPPTVEIYSITLNGGGSDVVFKKFTGKTSQYGALSLRLKEDSSKIKVINIGESGVISAN